MKCEYCREILITDCDCTAATTIADLRRQLMHLNCNLSEVTSEYERYRRALEQIAAPKRPDGTYNRCREACELLARQALRLDA